MKREPKTLSYIARLIRQLRELHCKYASMLSYIALLNKEIARNAAILEAKREMRKSEKTKHEDKQKEFC